MEYGNGSECKVCNGTGGNAHVLRSTKKLETLASKIADNLKPCVPRTKKGAMLGLLNIGPLTIAAWSGSTGATQNFILGVRDVDRTVAAIAQSYSDKPTWTLGGARVPAKVAKSGLYGGVGCVCAAPKLIAFVTQRHPLDGFSATELKSATMVEMWVGKNHKTYRHGVVAASCANCVARLPTLQCRASLG